MHTFTALGPLLRSSPAPLTSTRVPQIARRKIPVRRRIAMPALSRFRLRLPFESGTTGRARGVPSASLGGEAGAGCTAPGSARPRLLRRAAICGAGGWAAERLPASAPPRAPLHPHRSVTLRAWLRRRLLLLSQQRGGRERLLGVSSPARLSCCRLLAAKEKVSAGGSVASHQSRQRPLCPRSRFPSPSGARVAARGVRKERRVFPTTLHVFTAVLTAMSTDSHTQTYSYIPSHNGTHA